MNGEERQLIMGLFDRLRGVDPGPKDRDAESLINQSMRQNPDAAYLLVQTNLVQEHALEQAGQRMQDLEQRVRELEDQVNRQPQQSSGGSFLGGLFGGSSAPQPRPAQRSGSVPSVGGRPMGAPQGGGSGSPWGNAPGYGNPGQQQYGGPQGYGAPQPAPGGGGGFMRSALTTAAGVAGGMLVANTISNMMHGSSAQAAGAASGASGSDMLPGPRTNETSYAADSNDPGTYDDAAQDAQQDADDDQDALQDADDDSDNDPGWGGGDDGSTDA